MKVVNKLELKKKIITKKIDLFKKSMNFWESEGNIREQRMKELLISRTVNSILSILGNETKLAEEEEVLEESILETINEISPESNSQKDYWKNIREKYQTKMLERMEKELEAQSFEIEELNKELEEAIEGREANLDAIKKAVEFEVGKVSQKYLGEIESLKTELNNKGETLLSFIDMLAREKVQNEKLQNTIIEQGENLREINEKLAISIKKSEKLENQLHKRRINFRKLGVKMREKVQQLTKKVKSQFQELVAQVEVKGK